jgi:ABC-type Fe3+ transport system substrate-binding protein
MKGEAFDVPIVQPPLAEVIATGHVIPETETPLATVAVALAVRKGAPKPDISTPDALKKTLLGAKSVAFPDGARGAAAGVSFDQTLKTLGIAEQMQAKITRAQGGGRAMEMLAKGEVEIGLTFLSEIVDDAGVEVVGILPREISTPTALVGFVSTKAKSPEAAKALLKYLSGPEARRFIRRWECRWGSKRGGSSAAGYFLLRGKKGGPMTEPIIICPNCKTEIKLTESLAAPLLAATKQDFEKRLAQKDTDIAKRESTLREREESLVKAKDAIDDQVAEKLKQERGKIAAEEAKKAKLVAANDLEQKAKEIFELNEVLKQRDEKLAEAQKAQADLIRKQRELDDAKREVELTVEKRIQEGLAATREQARKEVEEQQKLKVAEKEQTILAMQKQIEELKRRAEQGSQQLQGEVQELELENLLRAKFPFDTIEPVPKGEFGGDALQRVVSPGGQPAARYFGNRNVPKTGAMAGWSS